MHVGFVFGAIKSLSTSSTGLTRFVAPVSFISTTGSRTCGSKILGNSLGSGKSNGRCPASNFLLCNANKTEAALNWLRATLCRQNRLVVKQHSLDTSSSARICWQQHQHTRSHNAVQAAPDDHQSANRCAELHHSTPTAGCWAAGSDPGWHCSPAQHVPLIAPCCGCDCNTRKLPRQHRRRGAAQSHPSLHR